MKFLLSAFLFIHPFAFSQTVTLFLVGDAGEPFVEKSTIGKALRADVAAAGDAATILFLGDNIYPAGLPEPDSKDYEMARRVLDLQMSWTKGLNAKTIFIPGNHDWNHWGERGLQYVRHQEKYIESAGDPNIILVPDLGCPGPVEIALNENSVLVILDSQWFLQEWGRPGKDSGCDLQSEEEVIERLRAILDRNRSKKVFVAAHHPIYSYGAHGGVFTLGDHLFPLRAVNSSLYIPLPVVGSLYPLYRKLVPHIQDIPHPVYARFANRIEEVMKTHPAAIYVAGHEHGLQHISKDRVHYIVSGSAAKTSPLRKKGHAEFVKRVKGYVKVTIDTNGSLMADFIRVDKRYPNGKSIYTTRLE